jgi:hypothetical protein
MSMATRTGMRRLHRMLPTAISRSVCTARGSNKDVSTEFRKHRLTGCTDLCASQDGPRGRKATTFRSAPLADDATHASRGDPAVDARAVLLKPECCIAGGPVTSMRLDQSSEMDEEEKRNRPHLRCRPCAKKGSQRCWLLRLAQSRPHAERVTRGLRGRVTPLGQE